MVTKTYIPCNICDSSDSSYSCDSRDSSDISHSSDSRDIIDSSDSRCGQFCRSTEQQSDSDSLLH